MSSPPDCEYSLLRRLIFAGSDASRLPVLMKWSSGTLEGEGEPEEERVRAGMRRRRWVRRGRRIMVMIVVLQWGIRCVCGAIDVDVNLFVLLWQ